jgi:(E)-4-hydroxy-3-methylbut-2-enyl-diphosphate synthase
MEFLRIAESENYYNIVLSMKSSNPRVMVQAYRLLIENMQSELGHCYPLHMGVTEAGDGEDGRIKSAIGIGTLLEDGIGDTIRVSLTEDSEFELPVCKNIVKRYINRNGENTSNVPAINNISILFPDITAMQVRHSFPVQNTGGNHVPVVVANFHKKDRITAGDLKDIGYQYNAITDKWNIGDMAADYIFCGNTLIDFALPGTLKLLYSYDSWKQISDKSKCFPLFNEQQFLNDSAEKSPYINFVRVDCYGQEHTVSEREYLFEKIKNDHTVVLCLSSKNRNAVQSIRRMFGEFNERNIKNPAVVFCDSNKNSMEESLIHWAIETGALFIDGFANGILLGDHFADNHNIPDYKLMNSIAFGILQATRTRISKTEFISCPSCGRTLFDLQETTAKVRAVTHHLKGLKIAIMGCIVNGPGEMADADFGYVGSGPGKITLYKGKEVIKRNVPESVAVEELINLLKENNAWIEPEFVLS